MRTHFTPLQRLLHWSMALAVLAMLFIGVGMVSTLAPAYLPLIATHRTLGIVILILALLRLAVRWRRGAPPLPPGMPRLMRLGAQLSHYGLYALMLGMPLIGWAMMSAAGYPIVLFGGIRLPPILPQDDALHTLLWIAHIGLVYAFFALVLMHAAAALYHGLVRRDGVFESMAPVPLRGE